MKATVFWGRVLAALGFGNQHAAAHLMHRSKDNLRLVRPVPSPRPPEVCDRGSHGVVEHGAAERAAANLRREVLSLLYRQMHALAGRAADLDDLVQMAAEQVFRSLSSFEGRSAPSTWTYRICYHTLLKQRRWHRRWLQRFSYAEDIPRAEMADERDSGQLLEQRERARRLRAALERVSAKRRAVVILHDLEELEVEEIAAIVGANEGTVRSRLRDGRKRLAEELERDAYFGVEAGLQEDQ
jgi:RNA polymerase sigma-70 factor, ECF subfamily